MKKTFRPKKMKFSQKDLSTLKSKGISPEKVEEQIASFVRGFSFLPIARAAVASDGIACLSSERVAELSGSWDRATQHKGLVIEKFVPASGAATRMFKEYFEFTGGSKASNAVRMAIENLEKFAFYDDLTGLGVDTKDAKASVNAIIESSGLGYGAKPKALIKFHKYKDGSRTALEEHLVEGALYGSASGGSVRIHFTVSPEHRAGFEQVLSLTKEKLENRFGITFCVTYSEQKPSTDTIAVDMQNEPLRNDNDELVFRPAGHGALIENLNEITADVIFVKTIDNVVPDHRKGDTILYKKTLAALGLELQGKIFGFLRAIDAGSAVARDIISFIETNIGYRFQTNTEPSMEQLRKVLDRPLRICGMVRNEGEPGGGPFWVTGHDGSLSLQIAESSQISPDQKPLMLQATHFNPVDLVCLTKNYKGERFDLTQYIDPSTGFISEKSMAGRALRAQELPGLWNGAMADWNTVFAEVPITTFAPVKVLTDLLRTEHQ